MLACVDILEVAMLGLNGRVQEGLYENEAGLISGDEGAFLVLLDKFL